MLIHACMHIALNSFSTLADTIEKSIGVSRSQCYAMCVDYMTTNASDSEYPWNIG